MAEYSLWNDEVLVFEAAESLHTLQDIYQLADYPAGMVHPPFFFALLRVWMTLVGQTDVALRTLTTLLGILSAALIYRVTVDLSRQPAAGLVAAIVFCSMGFASYYIHEVHNYSLLMTEAAALLLFYHRWQERPQTRYAIGIVAAELLLIYTSLCINLSAAGFQPACPAARFPPDTPLDRASDYRRAGLRILAAYVAVGHHLRVLNDRSTQCLVDQYANELVDSARVAAVSAL